MSTHSIEIAALATALAKAQGEIQGAIKDSTNPYFNASYADLASVWDACRAALSKYGLSVIQTTENSQDGICVVTLLAHSSGQWVRGVLPIMAAKKDPQGIGSAITYSRRYALAAIAGVVQIDDDGEAAEGRKPGTPTTDAVGNPSDCYRIDFGQWSRKSLKELYHDDKVGPKKIAEYIAFLESAAHKKSQELSGSAKIFVMEAERFLGTMENGGSS